MHLTKRYCDSAKYEETENRRDVRWHDDPRNMGLRIYPSGEKSFVLSYRAAGRKKMMVLADYSVLTLDEAEKRARRELVAVENDSADPLAEKRKRELESRTGTIEQVFSAYLAAKKPKRSADLLALAKRDIYPKLGTRPWRELRRSEVRSWHEAFKSDYVANRALQALRAAMYWRLWQDDDNGEQTKRDNRNPCAGVGLRKEKPRQVRLELAELPKMEAAIDAETDDPYVRAVFRFILATGCRRGEALSLKWDDVDLGDTPTVTFRETKNNTDRTVPLSPFAKQMLKRLPRLEKNPYVFVGHRHGTHLQAVSKAWQRIRKRAGIEHVRIHDLRRSFGSWLGDAGYTSKQVGDVLGHKSDITSRVYMALGDASRRNAVNTVRKLMTNAGKPKKKAKVLKFPQRATR
jgi:integrase